MHILRYSSDSSLLDFVRSATKCSIAGKASAEPNGVACAISVILQLEEERKMASPWIVFESLV